MAASRGPGYLTAGLAEDRQDDTIVFTNTPASGANVIPMTSDDGTLPLGFSSATNRLLTLALPYAGVALTTGATENRYLIGSPNTAVGWTPPVDSHLIRVRHVFNVDAVTGTVQARINVYKGSVNASNIGLSIAQAAITVDTGYGVESTTIAQATKDAILSTDIVIVRLDITGGTSATLTGCVLLDYRYDA